MFAVEAQGLSKRYGSVHSLRDCDLRIGQGIVFGLLGPNGAGKTTLLRTLLGFVRPAAGTARVCGHDVRSESLRVRAQVSYLPGDARLYRAMRGSQVLKLLSGLHPCGSLARSNAIAARLELETDRRVMFMSTGMRQKLALALVLGCEAPLIVLDEPTANLDPNIRALVLTMVREIRADGRTVLLSSHIFSDVDETCDEVAIMRQGSIVAVEDLREREQLHIVTANLNREHDVDALAGKIQEHPCSHYVRLAGGQATARLEIHLTGDPGSWLAWLATLPLTDMQIEKAGIRAIYQRHHHQLRTLDQQQDNCAT